MGAHHPPAEGGQAAAVSFWMRSVESARAGVSRRPRRHGGVHRDPAATAGAGEIHGAVLVVRGDGAGGQDAGMAQSRRPLRPVSWWWILAGAVLVTAAVAVSMWALLAQTHGLRGQA